MSQTSTRQVLALAYRMLVALSNHRPVIGVPFEYQSPTSWPVQDTCMFDHKRFVVALLHKEDVLQRKSTWSGFGRSASSFWLSAAHSAINESRPNQSMIWLLEIAIFGQNYSMIINLWWQPFQTEGDMCNHILTWLSPQTLHVGLPLQPQALRMAW